VKITVTEAPTPELPTTNYSGLAILLSLMFITGLFYVSRRKLNGVS